jgi:hypothetical protein
MGGDCSQKAHALEGNLTPLRGGCKRPAVRSQDSIANAAVQFAQVVFTVLNRWVQYGKRLAKRRRAMLESNPPRNNRPQTHQDDETRGETRKRPRPDTSNRGQIG